MLLYYKLKLWVHSHVVFCGFWKDHKILLLENWNYEVLVGCILFRDEIVILVFCRILMSSLWIEGDMSLERCW